MNDMVCIWVATAITVSIYDQIYIFYNGDIKWNEPSLGASTESHYIQTSCFQ